MASTYSSSLWRRLAGLPHRTLRDRISCHIFPNCPPRPIRLAVPNLHPLLFPMFPLLLKPSLQFVTVILVFDGEY